MPYDILQFNLGKDQAQGFVLRGLGEHEGTNVSLSPREIDDAILQAEQRLKLCEMDYTPRRPSLLLKKEPADPRLTRAIAEYLDRRFLLAHAERLRPNSVAVGKGDLTDS